MADSGGTGIRLVSPKGAKSAYWAHFGFEVGPDGERVDEKSVLCRICSHKVGFSGNTTNLGQHLQKWHPEVLTGEGSEAKTSKQQLTLEACSVRPISKLPSGSKRAQDITRKIAEFIARDMRPVSSIEGVGFVNLIATLDPTYQVPSRKHVMKVLHEMRDDVTARLQAELGSAESVAVTTDHWTSHAMDSYLGVTVHFITGDWELVTRVLQVAEVRESHTAVNVAHDLQAVVEKWELESKVAGCTTDNARNMVAALALLPWPRVPCIAHTLQLAVKEGLKVPAVVQVLGRCRKIVGHFKHSYVASRALEAAQDRLKLPKNHLIQEICTRWNSSYAMLSRIAEQQTAISAVLAESTKAADRDMILSSVEIAQVECAMAVLKPLSQATEMLSREKMPSFSVIQPLLTALQKKHLKVSAVEPKMALDMKEAITGNLARHFSDDERRKLMLVATCLDPRFSRLKFLSSRERTDVYAKVASLANECYHPSSGDEQEDIQVAKKPKRDSLLDYNDSSSDSNGTSPGVDRVEREISRYKTEEEIDSNGDPLMWWKLNHHRFPILSILARRFLCITATSVPCERIFSDAGVVVNRRRCALDPNNVECLLFLHSNLK